MSNFNDYDDKTRKTTKAPNALVEYVYVVQRTTHRFTKKCEKCISLI